MDHVATNLYVGSLSDAAALVAANPNKIAAVLNCCFAYEGTYPLRSDVIYKRIPFPDSAIPEESFWEALEFIKERIKSGNVLVQCREGLSRSVTIAASFMSNGTLDGLDAALKQIKAAHPDASPNVKVLDSARGRIVHGDRRKRIIPSPFLLDPRFEKKVAPFAWPSVPSVPVSAPCGRPDYRGNRSPFGFGKSPYPNAGLHIDRQGEPICSDASKVGTTYQGKWGQNHRRAQPLEGSEEARRHRDGGNRND
jgi:hypothetical protein